MTSCYHDVWHGLFVARCAVRSPALNYYITTLLFELFSKISASINPNPKPCVYLTDYSLPLTPHDGD
jgi:hypothetical protein